MSVKTLPGKGILEIVWLLVKTAAAVMGQLSQQLLFILGVIPSKRQECYSE